MVISSELLHSNHSLRPRANNHREHAPHFSIIIFDDILKEMNLFLKMCSDCYPANAFVKTVSIILHVKLLHPHSYDVIIMIQIMTIVYTCPLFSFSMCNKNPKSSKLIKIMIHHIFFIFVSFLDASNRPTETRFR